jgi:hypothetical protein
MNDLKDLLSLALDDGHGPRPMTEVEPGADLIRGRRLVRRRNLLAGAGIGVAAIAVAGAGVALPRLGSAGNHNMATTRTSPAPSGSTSQTTTLSSVALVAYTGEQVPGYQVAEVPSGWTIQGGNAYALVLGRKGMKDTNINSFEGKLVVMLQSKDAKPPTDGPSQPVNGQPGRFHVEGKTQILAYQLPDKRWVVVQAPVSLGWDGSRLARFAAGAQVLGNAEAGVG